MMDAQTVLINTLCQLVVNMGSWDRDKNKEEVLLYDQACRTLKEVLRAKELIASEGIRDYENTKEQQ